VEQVKGELEKSDLIFSVKAGKISVKQIAALRSSLPETSKAQVVKNTLMTRYGLEEASESTLLDHSLFCIFIKSAI